MRPLLIVGIVLLIIAIIGGTYTGMFISQPTPQAQSEPTPSPTPQPEPSICKDCYQGKITNIIDGDTLVIDNKVVRLALVNTPEFYQENFEKAKAFTQSICLIGSTATIDVDQKQPTDKYNRTIAVVYCNNTNLNQELINKRLATIDQRYCNISEFKNEEWAIGC